MHACHVSTCMPMEKSIKREGNQFVQEESNKRERKEKNMKEKKKERGEKGNRHSDGQNSSDQEVKSVYSMRATL